VTAAFNAIGTGGDLTWGVLADTLEQAGLIAAGTMAGVAVGVGMVAWHVANAYYNFIKDNILADLNALKGLFGIGSIINFMLVLALVLSFGLCFLLAYIYKTHVRPKKKLKAMVKSRIRICKQGACCCGY
jgi:hypothetical protein